MGCLHQSEQRKTLHGYYLCIPATKTFRQISAGALSSGVEKALQVRRQACLIWSILCHVWSNPAKAVGWKWRCKYWYFIRGNHPLRRHLTGPPSECGGRSAAWPAESGSHFITRLNWVEKGEATTRDPIWSDNLGPEERGWSRGKNTTSPSHNTGLNSRTFSVKGNCRLLGCMCAYGWEVSAVSEQLYSLHNEPWTRPSHGLSHREQRFSSASLLLGIKRLHKASPVIAMPTWCGNQGRVRACMTISLRPVHILSNLMATYADKEITQPNFKVPPGYG